MGVSIIIGEYSESLTGLFKEFGERLVHSNSAEVLYGHITIIYIKGQGEEEEEAHLTNNQSSYRRILFKDECISWRSFLEKHYMKGDNEAIKAVDLIIGSCYAKGSLRVIGNDHYLFDHTTPWSLVGFVGTGSLECITKCHLCMSFDVPIDLPLDILNAISALVEFLCKEKKMAIFSKPFSDLDLILSVEQLGNHSCKFLYFLFTEINVRFRFSLGVLGKSQ